MLKVKGVYDGQQVILLEPITLPPDTKVEVLIPDIADEPERAYWQRLIEVGLVKEVRRRSTAHQFFRPIQVVGAPLSQNIVDERR